MKKINQETTYTYEITSTEQLFLVGLMSLVLKHKTIGNIEIVNSDIEKISNLLRELD
jgi:hypothetical protein